MLRTMGNYKLGFKATIFVFAILFSFAGCSESVKGDICFVLDMAGLLKPREAIIDLSLEKLPIEEVFSFSNLCDEKYDSLFLVYPYFNTNTEDFEKLKMSKILRRICDNNTNFDSFFTLLLLRNGIVEAYSIIERVDAEFDSSEVEEHYIFPINQKFMMDKDRIIHI